MDFGRNKKKF